MKLNAVEVGILRMMSGTSGSKVGLSGMWGGGIMGHLRDTMSDMAERGLLVVRGEQFGIAALGEEALKSRGRKKQRKD